MSAVETSGIAFVIGGVPVVLEGDERQCRDLRELWEGLFNESLGAGGLPVFLTLQTEPHVTPFGEEVYAADALRVLRTSSGFFLTCGASSLSVLPGEAATCYLEGFETHTLYEQREFFLLGLLMLLRPRGLYGLHACGVQRGGVGALLVGSSGAGKTTTTLNLLRSGWSYLSDDAILLQEQDDGVEALAFRRGFSCTPETLKRLGHPETVPESGAFGDPSGKRQLTGAEYDFVSRCRPTLLLFPRRGAKKTRLSPLAPPLALVELCRHSAGIMTDQAVSRGQLELLKKLVQNAQSFELALAPDALAEPDLVSRLLDEIISEQVR